METGIDKFVVVSRSVKCQIVIENLGSLISRIAMVLFFPSPAIFDFDTYLYKYILISFCVCRAYRLMENYFETVATVT